MWNRKICVPTFCSLVLTQPQRFFFTPTIFRLNRQRRTTKHLMIYVRAQFEWVAPADSSVFNSQGSRPSFTSVFPDNIDKHTATCASFTRLFPEVFVPSSSFNSRDGPRRRGPQAIQTWYRSKFVSALTFWFWFTVVGLFFFSDDEQWMLTCYNLSHLLLNSCRSAFVSSICSQTAHSERQRAQAAFASQSQSALKWQSIKNSGDIRIVTHTHNLPYTKSFVFR